MADALRAENDHFWLDGEVNGQPLRLSFDTGSDETVLFPKALKRLKLSGNVPPADIRLDGGTTVGQTPRVELKIAGTSCKTVFGILPSDPPSYEVPFDGMLGWPTISGNILIIEPATLTLKAVGEVAPEPATWSRFRVLTNYDILALEIPGAGTNKLVVEIDTGKQAGVTLSPERWEQWKTAHPHRSKTLLQYFMFGSGNVVREESWADEIALGPLVLTDVPVMEANLTETRIGSTATLGMAALKRLDLVVDGRHNLAYVRPKLTPPASYEHNRLGAVFNQDGSKEGELVAHVIPRSPAAEAGIQDGDILLKVNEHSTANVATDPELAPLVLEWHRPAGSQFVLTLMRGGNIFKTTVSLQDILKPEKILPAPAKELASEVQWLEALGDAAFQETNNDQAINNYSEVIRLNPSAADAFNRRGAAYTREGSNEPALADFNEAIRLKPANAEALNNRGSLWQIKGELDKAIVDYSEAIKLEPDFPGAFFDRGSAYRMKGEYDHALDDFSVAIRLKPDLAEALRARGELFFLTNNFAAAISNLSAAIRLNPVDAETLNNRGMAYRQTGAFDEAIADLTAALRLKPDLVQALMNRGLAYSGKQDFDRAIADFSHVMTLDAKNLDAIEGRADAYYGAGDYARAVADFTQLEQSNPENTAIFINRGLCFEAEGKYDEAIADFTQSIRLNSNAVAIEHRGDSYKKKKEYARAEADYQRLLELEPGKPEGFIKLAQLLASSPDDSIRDGKKAVQYAQKACELTSWTDGTAIDVLAMAYAANGNFTDAIKWEKELLGATLPEAFRATALDRLKLYQQNKPYRESD